MARKASKNVDFDYIEIDTPRIDKTVDNYYKWKSLNAALSDLAHRGLNLPDSISEPMGCYVLGFKWNRGTVGDATDQHGRKIEFKASSNFSGDLSSFGPKTTFDDLVMLRFDTENDVLFLYDLGINSDQLGQFKANKKETVADQKAQKRRPHIRLIEDYIIPNKIAPTAIFKISNKKITHGVSFEDAEAMGNSH